MDLPAADGRVIAHSFQSSYVYATGDATGLYNSVAEDTLDVANASRSIVWLKSDHIVAYDRADSLSPGHAKRFWLHRVTPALMGRPREATAIA